MARAVRTWNPAWLTLSDEARAAGTKIRPFTLKMVADDHEHNPNNPDECIDCGAFLCGLCGSDQHNAEDGHDLSNPAYWGF